MGIRSALVGATAVAQVQAVPCGCGSHIRHSMRILPNPCSLTTQTHFFLTRLAYGTSNPGTAPFPPSAGVPLVAAVSHLHRRRRFVQIKKKKKVKHPFGARSPPAGKGTVLPSQPRGRAHRRGRSTFHPQVSVRTESSVESKAKRKQRPLKKAEMKSIKCIEPAPEWLRPLLPPRLGGHQLIREGLAHFSGLLLALSWVPLSFLRPLHRQVLAGGFHPDRGGIWAGNAILRPSNRPGAGKDPKLPLHPYPNFHPASLWDRPHF